MRSASPRAASPARRSSTSPARRASAAACSTTTSGRRSGCSSRSSAATARSASRGSTSRSRAAGDGASGARRARLSLLDLIENEPGFFVLLFELFTAGRRNPEIQREVGRPLPEDPRAASRPRSRQGRRRASIALRFGAEPTVAYLFAIADGIAVQALSDPDLDHAEVIEAGREAARHALASSWRPESQPASAQGPTR